MKKDASTSDRLTAVVVNDDPTQLSVLSALAEKADLEVLSFSEAEVALSEMNPETPPDIIISDLYMPGIDGWRFCRLLRSDEYPAFNSVPIIIVSATFSGYEVSSLTADIGANAFMSAPVDTKKFIETIQALLQGEKLEETLRVLIVEDSKTQARILKKAFITVGHEADVTDTVEAAMSALSETSYDVAVLDYHLPDGTGDTVLDTLRAQQPHCVCIMMTADIDPKLALDWMKRGSAARLRKPFDAEYLLEVCAKARRERTLLRTEDLLEERTHQLFESERKYRELFQDVPIGLYQTTPEGKILTANAACLKAFRCPEEDREKWFAQDGRDIYVNPEDCERFRELIRKDGFVEEFEASFHRWDGTVGWHSDSAQLVYDEDGNEIINGSFVDITERKQVEEALLISEEHLRALSDASFEAIFLSEKGICIGQNLTAERMFGYTTEDAVGRPGTDWIAPEDRDMVMENMLAGRLAPYQATALRNDGTTFDAEIQARTVDYQGRSVRLTALRDISDRKLAEEALQLTQSSVDNAPNAFYWMRSDAKFIYVNQASIQSLGYSKEELLTMTVHDIDPEFPKEGWRTHWAELQEKGSMIIESMHKRKDGSVFPVEITANLFHFGKTEIHCAVATDITNRKQAEQEVILAMEKVESSEKKFRAITNQSSEGITVADTDGNYLFVNRTFCMMMGYTEEELLQMTVFDMKAANQDKSSFEKSKTSREGVPFPVILQRKDGTEFTSEVTSRLIDFNGKDAVLGTIRDITERKLAEEALSSSEENLRITLDSIGDAVIATDTQGKITRINHVAEKLTGWTLEKAKGRVLTDVFNIVNALTGEKVENPVTKVLDNGETVGLANHTMLISKDGTEYQIADSGAPIKDEDGNVSGVVLVFRDVTEEYRIGQLLREKTLMLDNILRSAINVAIATTDLDFRITYYNPMAEKLFGYSAEEVIGKTVQEIHTKNNVAPERFERAIKEIHNKGQFEYSLTQETDDGIRYVDSSVTGIYNPDGDLVGFSLFSYDVTVDHLLQKELKESTIMLMEAQKVAKLGHYELSAATGIWTCSSELENIFGIDKKYNKDISGWLNIVHPDDKEGLTNYLQDNIFEQHQNFDKEYKIVDYETGEEKWVHGLGSLIFDDNNDIVKMFGTIQDITESKKAEKELRESEEKFRKYAENAPGFVTIYDCYPDNRRETLFFSPGMEKLLSNDIYDKLNNDINNYFGIIHPDDIEEFQKEADIAEESDGIFNFEYRISTSPDEYIWMRSIAQCVKYGEGVVRWYCQIFDISEQKQAEEIQRDHVQFLESLSEIDQVIRGSVNPENILDEVIESVSQLFECDRAWLLTPCDPDSSYYRIPVESTRPEYPGANTLDLELPITPEVQAVMRISLAAEGPVTFSPDGDNPVPSGTAEQFGVQSQMVLSIHPRAGDAWIFGLHQCTHPRVWTEHEQRLFNEIGRRVADTLSSALFLRDLKGSEARLLQAQKTAHIGDWTHDLINDKVIWSDESFRIMGIQPQELTAETVARCIHPNDLPSLMNAMEESAEGREENECEFRVIHPNGETHYVHNRWMSSYDADGKEITRAGTLQDVTTRVQSEEALREGELRLLSVVESTSDGIVISDQAGNVAMWNNGAQTMFGYGAHEIIGKSIEILMPESYRSLLSKVISRLMETGKGKILNKTFEVEGLRKDGSTFPLELALSTWESGKQRFVAAISRDITERKQFEESLRETADSLKVAQRIANMGSWSWDIESNTITLSDNSCSMFGIMPEEFDGSFESALSFIHPDDREIVSTKLSAISENKQPEVFEYSIVTKDGEEKIVRSHQQLVLDNEGHVIRLVGTMQDITERKQAEASVVESETRYRTLFESASDAIFLMTDQKFTDCNKMTLDMFGCKREDIVGHSPVDFSPPLQPDGKKSSEEAMKRINATLEGNPQHFEWQHCKLDGSVFDAEVSLNLVELSSGTFIQAIVRDVTERKQAEDAIRESEHMFRSVIEQSNDALYILADERFELINRRFTELTGITEEDAADPDFDFMETLTPESKEVVQERFEMRDRGEEPPSVYEFSLIHKDGNIHHVQASVTEIDYRDGKAILGILRDVSEQKSLEDQLRQAQKIESIGHLAGGIAHDFNNLLTPIIGNTELAMMQMEPSNPLYEDLHEINETAIRASVLTRQLLAFSRKQVLDVKIVNLNKLIENFRKILRRTIREDIKITMKYGTSIGNIRVDVSQIEQILMNLLVNAQDAMSAGGVITISTESVFLDKDYAENHPGVKVGQYILLSVSDTGEGIPEEIVQKIFDPFFTTKDVGKGTGLGLSTVYGIIKQHGGNIWVDSVPDRGTTFKLYLPHVEDGFTESSDSGKETNTLVGTGVILVVEDQADVRLIASRILKTCGYTVHAASSGSEAIAMIREGDLSIDLLLTDVIMPNMNGQELYTQLSEIHPGIKAIYMSGYTQDIISQQGVLDKGIDFLQKPLTVDALAGKVKEVLGRDDH